MHVAWHRDDDDNERGWVCVCAFALIALDLAPLVHLCANILYMG